MTSRGLLNNRALNRVSAEFVNFSSNENVNNLENKINTEINNLKTSLDESNPQNIYWDYKTMNYINTVNPTTEQKDIDLLFKELLGLTYNTTIDKVSNTSIYPATSSDYINVYYWNKVSPTKTFYNSLDLLAIQNKLKDKYPFNGLESSNIKYGLFNYSIENDLSETEIFTASLIYISRSPITDLEDFVVSNINTKLDNPLFEVKNKSNIIIGASQGPREGSAHLWTISQDIFNTDFEITIVPRLFQYILPKNEDTEKIKEGLHEHTMFANLSHNWYKQSIYKASGETLRSTNIIDFFDFVTDIKIQEEEYLLLSSYQFYSGVQGLVGHIATTYKGLNKFIKDWYFDKTLIPTLNGDSHTPKLFVDVFKGINSNNNNKFHISQPLNNGIGSFIPQQEIIQQYSHKATQKFIDDWNFFNSTVLERYYSLPGNFNFTIPDSPIVDYPISNKMLFFLSAFNIFEIPLLFSPPRIYSIIGPSNLTKDNLINNGYIELIK